MVNEIKSFNDSIVEGGILKHEDIDRIDTRIKNINPRKKLETGYGKIMHR